MRVTPWLLRIKGMNIIIFLAFVASIEFVHETDSEYEFTNEQNACFLENIVVEHQCLIEKFLEVNDVVNSHKSKINLLC